MSPHRMTAGERRLVEQLVAAYERDLGRVTLFRDQLMLALTGSEELRPLIHSIRSRVKDPGHLKDKLERKLAECHARRRRFRVNAKNLFTQVNDLAGVRILHLHTRQIGRIDRALRGILREGHYELVEGPFARTWDDESRELLKRWGIQIQKSGSLYTSVHYVVGSASRTRTTAEIQVRTLSEELWGEVDHALNYPHKTDSVACAEQLRVLARVASGATRLVDSIFATAEDHLRRSAGTASTRARSVPARGNPGRRGAT